MAAYRIAQEALTNVRKHAGRAASATVRITYGTGSLVVDVTDDGCGDTNGWSRLGAGQGLIGMRERVEIYGGQLTAGPRPNGGFAVRAVLPIVDDCASTVRLSGRAGRAGGIMTIRVAIVDDQALMRDGFGMILDAQPDIDVVGDAENGRAGVELCHRSRPDVVLMDIRMPILDGIEATRSIVSSGGDDRGCSC